jgi:CPA2 family monovalent cation:H+ antiporter-2
MPTTTGHSSGVLIELGLAVLGLALLARIANRLGFSAIPLYLIAGLAFGKGGLAPLPLSQNFIEIGADIGVLLLLFMLGLEYGGEQLKQDLQAGLPAGVADLLLNFTPGLAAGLLLGWPLLPSILLGGVTYISSSGVIAKVLSELGRTDNPETPLLLSVLVLEDLAMAVYLPLIGVLISGGGWKTIVFSVTLALTAVACALVAALRFGRHLSSFAHHQSSEVIVLTVFGAVLLVSGSAEHFHISAGIGAFLVGIALSGPVAEHSHRLLEPLRDLFAATFFFFFGLEIDPSTLVPSLPVALVLGVVTAFTKVLTGYWAAVKAGIDQRGRWRAGVALIPRGEFSIVIAGLGVAIEPRLGPLAAAYVLLLALTGPILARLTK